jgi:hypothetical protein
VIDLPVAGTIIHALDAISLCGVTLKRGDSLKLTEDMIELTIDKRGNSWLSIVNDEDAQEEKWGAPKIGSGVFPADLSPFVPGSPDEDVERDRRRKIAWAEPNDEKRRAMLRDIQRELGSKPTSKTLFENMDRRG